MITYHPKLSKYRFLAVLGKYYSNSEGFMTDMVKFGKQFLKATFTTFCDLLDIRTKARLSLREIIMRAVKRDFCKEALSKKSWFFLIFWLRQYLVLFYLVLFWQRKKVLQLAVNKVNLLFDFCLIVLSEAFPNMDFIQRVPQSRIYWLSLWIQKEQKAGKFKTHHCIFVQFDKKRHNFVLENVERKDGV